MGRSTSSQCQSAGGCAFSLGGGAMIIMSATRRRSSLPAGRARASGPAWWRGRGPTCSAAGSAPSPPPPPPAPARAASRSLPTPRPVLAPTPAPGACPGRRPGGAKQTDTSGGVDADPNDGSSTSCSSTREHARLRPRNGPPKRGPRAPGGASKRPRAPRQGGARRRWPMPNASANDGACTRCPPKLLRSTPGRT